MRRRCWGPNSILCYPPDEDDRYAQMADHPHMVVPLVRGHYIPHGAKVSESIRDSLHTYGGRLSAGYLKDLHTLCDACEQYGQPYDSPRRNRPFWGVGDSSHIFEALHPQVAGDRVAGMRMVLFSAIRSLRHNSDKDSAQFIRRLAHTIAREEEPAPVFDKLCSALRDDESLTAETTEEIATELGFRRNPGRRIAIQTLDGLLRSRARAETAQATSKAPGRAQEKTPAPELPASSPTESSNGEPEYQRPSLQLRRPDPRLHIDGQLTTDIEASLSADEARFLYHCLTRPNDGRSDDEVVADLVLLLMLLTARDAASIIHALANQFQHDRSQFEDELNIQVLPVGWISRPGPGLEAITASGDVGDNHDKDIVLRFGKKTEESVAVLKDIAGRRDIRDLPESVFRDRITAAKNHVPRLTLERLRRTMPALVYHATGHPRSAQLLIGTDGYRSAAPLAYYCPAQSTMAEAYARALAAADIDTGDVEADGHIRVGSASAMVDREALRSAIRLATMTVQKRSRQPSAVTRFNAIAIHTALMFAAATAHRLTFDLPGTKLMNMVRFEAGPGVAYVCDKRHEGMDRIAAMPTRLCRQVDQMLAVLEHVRTSIPLLPSRVRDRIDGALTGSGPLFFTIDLDARRVRPITRSKLQDHLGSAVDIRKLRHWYATRAEELDAHSSADIAQQMGHRVDGEPYTHIDPDSPWHFARRLDEALEHYLDDIGLEFVGSVRTARRREWGAPLNISSVFSLANVTVRAESPPDGIPRSEIGPAHIAAYRLAQQIEDRALYALRKGRQDSGVACVILSILWGVTTSVDRVLAILKTGELYQLPHFPTAAVLTLPQAQTIHGAQLLSAHQTLVLRKAIDWYRSASTNPLNEYRQAARGLIADEAALEHICRLSSLARRMTAPGHRAAWERGALSCSGPRPDRLIAMATGMRVVATDPEWDLPSHTRYLGKTPHHLYDQMRKSLNRWRQQPDDARRRDSALQAAEHLSTSSPEDSIPYIVAIALQAELDVAKSKRLKPSTIYGYVTAYSDIITEAMDALDQSETAKDTTDSLLTQWLERRIYQDENTSPALWIARRVAHRLLPSDFLDLIRAIEEAPTTASPRAGDPITSAECAAIRHGFTPAVSSGLPDRPAHPDTVLALAYRIQSRFSLRTRELANITYADYFAGHLRQLISIHPRVHLPLKRVASQRLAVSRLTKEESEDIAHPVRLIHGTQTPNQPQQVSLCPTPKGQHPTDWLRKYNIRFATTAARLFNKDTPPIRPHGFRHSAATAHSYHQLPAHYPHVFFDLPYDQATHRFPPRWSLRGEKYHHARQLGHGHPETTLTHYDHAIPLMTDVHQGWRTPSTETLASLVGVTTASLRQAMHRAKHRGNPVDTVLVGRLDLPSLLDHYEITEFGPASDPTDDTASVVSSQTTKEQPGRIRLLATTAIAHREGRTADDIAAVQDRPLHMVQADITLLEDVDADWGINYLHGSGALHRKSRTEALIHLLTELADHMPVGRMVSLGHALLNTTEPHSVFLRYTSHYNPDTLEIPRVGDIRRRCVALVLITYGTMDNED